MYQVRDMWTLLLSAFLLVTPVSLAQSPSSTAPRLEQSESTPSSFQWRDLTKVEVLIAVLIPLLAALSWVLRDYAHKTRVVERQLFKEDLIQSLSYSINETLSRQQVSYEQKLQPIKQSLIALAKELRVNDASNSAADENIRERIAQIHAELSQLESRIARIEGRLENLVNCINTELSTALSAYFNTALNVDLSSCLIKKRSVPNE